MSSIRRMKSERGGEAEGVSDDDAELGAAASHENVTEKAGGTGTGTGGVARVHTGCRRRR